MRGRSRRRYGRAMLDHDVRGSGPPIVLLHAGVADRRMWDGVRETLERDHLVIAPDLRGYGRSALGDDDFSHVDDRTTGTYTFNRVDADLRQFIGFLAERRVLAARLFVSTSDTKEGHVMPFYLMPTLGGNDTLRGFREYRFRGPHAILLQGEYRFEVWSALDVALFYDAGKVAMTRSDLDFENLQSDYGIGFRFNTNAGIVLRVDAAFGSRDGKHLYIVWGGVF